MTDNRIVAEPAGYDHATERIPVPGDLSAERSDEPVPEVPAPDAAEPVAGAGENVLDDATTDRFRDRWRELQSGFVDDPAGAVRGADELVVEVMRELAERRARLADRWREEQAGTEELRVVIRAYRAYFSHLLNS